MIVREMRDLLNSITDEDDLNAEIVMPMKSDMPGVFAFEGVCSGATGFIYIGPAPEFIGNENAQNKGKEMQAFLIAPHSYHAENAHEDEEFKHN